MKKRIIAVSILIILVAAIYVILRPMIIKVTVVDSNGHFVSNAKIYAYIADDQNTVLFSEVKTNGSGTEDAQTGFDRGY